MSLVDMAKSYLVAKLGPSSTPDVAVERLSVCFSCAFRVNKDGNNYCNKCGCPKLKIWPDSELSNKVMMLRATCPKGKWRV